MDLLIEGYFYGKDYDYRRWYVAMSYSTMG